MLKYIFSLAILAQLVYAREGSGYAQEGSGYAQEGSGAVNDAMYDENTIEDENGNAHGGETVSVWTVAPYHNEDLNSQCAEECNKTCVRQCPAAQLCKKSEIECGKKDHPANVWPDCIKDDICVPDGCDCQTPGNDGSECPLWCEVGCTDTQIKCTGKKDDNGCKENDVCIDRVIGNDNQLCSGYCPVECNVHHEHKCPTPPDNGCPQAPTCNTKTTNSGGEYCDEQQCPLTCPPTQIFCAGEQKVDGCYKKDICVAKIVSDSGALCDGNCPITCDPITEILCDGTIIYHGPKAGCANDDSCSLKARDVNGQYCPDNSDSHGCPITCDDDEHQCPTRTETDNCKEQATCTPCTKGEDGECCPQASDCPALCQPHEKECPTTGVDDNGCKLSPTCVVQDRDYYGDLCTVYCPGTCNDGQILCPGARDDSGCQDPSFCEPLKKKLWGEGAPYDWCPGYCPADCNDWETLCSSVEDPCDGCPTEPVCKPKAKDANGINCPPESASHGCAISCKTLDGIETICPAYEDPTAAGCKEQLICLPRSTGKNGLCPAHSVCPKKCTANEKQCAQGYDVYDCKKGDLCIPVPKDDTGHDCLDFECPPSCDEEVQKYCQGQYIYNQNGQLCPLRDYCVDRALDYNKVRCPGHCEPECGSSQVVSLQTGYDARGCPLASVCMYLED